MAKGSSSVNKAVNKSGQAKKGTPPKIAPQPSSAILTTLKRARGSLSRYKYEEAYNLLTRAIDSGELDPAREFDARDARRRIFWRLYDPMHQWEDLHEMAKLGRRLKDPVRQARLTLGQAAADSTEHPQKSVLTAQTALRKARKLKLKTMEAEALLFLGLAYSNLHERKKSDRLMEQAAACYREAGDRNGLGWAVGFRGAGIVFSGNMEGGTAFLEQALEILRGQGDLAGETAVLIMLGLATDDLALAMSRMGRALQLSEPFDRFSSGAGSERACNNLCVFTGSLGLYRKSRELGERAVRRSRETQSENFLSFALESLARPVYLMGEHEAAFALLEECIAVSRKVEQPGNEAASRHLMGRILLAQGDPRKARTQLRSASRIARQAGENTLAAASLSWLAGTELALKNEKAALLHSAQALALMEKGWKFPHDYPRQQVWWWRYRALQAGKGSRPGLEAFAALKNAHELVFSQVENLSDEGLRRNYFNKVEINRLILLEWAKVATARKIPLELPEAMPGSLSRQLQRVTEIGERFNEEHNEPDLLDLILDEAVELSGAERALLLLKNESGDLIPSAGYLLSPKEMAALAAESADLISRASLSRQPVLVEDAGPKSKKEPAYLHCVRLAVPLLLHGQALGVLYLDMRRLFGRLNEEDSNLLSVLCNQAASALENARLVSGLEQKVEARTRELNQKVDELAIINSVQEGLAKQLDLQGIIDLIGRKVGKIFAADTTMATLYDAERDWAYDTYYVDRGQRIPFPDGPAARPSLGAIIADSRKPLLLGTKAESEKLGALRVPRRGEKADRNESYLGMPILTGGKVIGLITVQSYKQNAYGQDDLRLLQTLAGAMSVALENARLFDETQHLLKETEQRAAELAIINSVQAGLASKLEMRSIYNLVGDQIRETFKADTTYIASYDHGAKLVYSEYYVEEGHAIPVQPLPFGQGLYSHVIRSQQPLILGTNQQQAELGAIAIPSPDSEEDLNQSYLGVPIMLGDEVKGVVSVQSHTEHAFDESDARLLQTLANSMSIALENARLFDETQRLLKETETRAQELAIINSVQQGLSSKLDMHAIYDLVGDKVRDIFDAQSVLIGIFDHATRTRNIPYMWEKGKRFEVQTSLPFSKIVEIMIETKAPIVIDEYTDQIGAFYGMVLAPGTDPMKSGVFVPLTAGDRVFGGVSLQNVDRAHAFSDADVRLLQTLATSMSIALENARLFDETQRLLKETEQRAAELAIINSVQEGLASKLDMRSIYQLVGDKVGEIFTADTTYIDAYDPRTQSVTSYYYVEKGQSNLFDLGSVPLDGLTGITAHIIRTRRPLRLGALQESVELGAVLIPSPGEEKDLNQSCLAVPILLGDEVSGVISVQSHKEHAFNESDLRLLQTLANSMSIALENARLFDETQRLLKETEQRAAELAIINSVQQGLASKLDMQAIYDLVGEKIMDMFNAQTILLASLDHEKQLTCLEYAFEDGERIYDDELLPFNGVDRHLIATRQPVVINENSIEVSRQYGMKVVEGTQPAKSMIFVPFGAGSQVNGYFSLQNMERENAFTETDVRLLQTLAGSMGIALENASLFKAEQQRAAELSAISTVSQALVAEPDLDNMIQLIGGQMQQIFNADIAYVALLDRETNLIHFPYQVGETFETLKLGEGLTSRIIQSGEPLLINKDISERRAQLGTTLVGRESLSYLGVPVRSGKETIGVLSVQSTQQEGMFNEDSMRLLTTIAASAGAAIHTARLHAETQRRAREMTTLAEIGSDIAASRDLEPVLERIASHAKEILRVSDIAIRLLEGNTLRTRVALGTYTEAIMADTIPLGQGITGNIAQTGVAEFVNYPLRHPMVRHIPGTSEEEEETEGLMCAPLISRGQTIGVINVWRSHTEGLFTQADLDFLVSVARQTAIAIESARLYLETQRRAREMATLVEVGRDISSSLEASTALEGIARHARDLLGAGTSALFLPEADGGTFRAITAVGEIADQLRDETISLGRGILGSIAAQKRGEIVNDTSSDPRGIKISGTEDKPYENLMAVPLLANDELKGLMAIWRSGKGTEFTEAELEFITGLSRQAVIAVQNTQLFNEVTRRKEYFETLFQNNPVAVVTIDNEARVNSWNPAAEKLFGYTQAEAMEKNVDDLVARTPDLHAEAADFSRIGLDTGTDPFQVLARRTRKDGSIVDVELSAVPIIVQGKKQGMYAIYHDVTELQRARQEAVAANEAKSSFLATMSHEIRTPMNAVIGMSGLLMDTELSKEQRDYAETIRNSGDALLAIINDILDFSKIEAGKMELEHQPFDLRECVESALDLVAGRAVEKNLDLAYIIEDDVPAGISGDVTRLRQILLNLFSNAVKFTEKGEVVLTVSRPEKSEAEARGSNMPEGLPPGSILFSVRDTGIGIPRNRMNRLFASFSQADSSTTRRYGGTGLGLAISKRLAEMMGGSMWATSAGAGKGATFSFFIQAPAAKVEPRKNARDASGIQSALQGKRVLIVDDNKTNRRILSLQAGKWGMTSRETASPRQALKWLKEGGAFDLAILDLQMPVMDGIMLTRELRKLKNGKLLPVILLTSLGRREVHEDELSFAAYLTKPLKPSALFDALAGIFVRHMAAPQPEPARVTTDPDMAKAHPLRILLAEDNAVNQKLALRILEQMGYRADVASNGLEAVESVERQTYDLVLMDVQMPDMDGLDATRAIRQLKGLPQPRIVAMTANAMQGDRELCIAAGMDDYISKPIRLNELIAALKVSKQVEGSGKGTAGKNGKKGSGNPK